MNSFELFEFQEYLEKPYLKTVENVFINQCVTPAEFKEFNNTFLGSQSQDYLSYLVGSALIDGTIPNNKEGYMKFLRIANGLSERFFRNTIHHAYNLSIINNKEKIFDNLISTAQDYMNKHSKSKPVEYVEIQFKDYIKGLLAEIELDPKFFELHDYQANHKKLQSHLLKEQLQEDLETNPIQKKSPKI